MGEVLALLIGAHEIKRSEALTDYQRAVEHLSGDEITDQYGD
jgi:hypothetical protein